MEKSPEAFRTIREVADAMDLPQHVLRFWETRFPQIRPLKRAGGRRYYRPDDIERLRVIKRLLYDEGYTIKGVQKLFKEQGAHALTSGARDGRPAFDAPGFGELAVADKEGPDAETGAAAGGGRRDASKGQGRAVAPSLGLSAEDLATLRQTLEDIRQAERILTLARSQDL
jgi:DNA-binding transcriptional MerR regulator